MPPTLTDDILQATKFLLVDDELTNITILENMLEQWQCFNVMSTTKPKEVMGLYEEFQPDIILLDVFLTGYDGRVICKQLKFHPDSKHIPVIMVSGNDEILQTVDQFGANDFIQKPFEAEELIARIENQFKNKETINN